MPAAPFSFHVLAKPFGPICNLQCSYCYYTRKKELYPPPHEFRMPEAVLESFIRQYIESQPVPEVVFGWQGGEPTLLGIEFFRRAVECQKALCPKELALENSLQTNGILLDDAWCEFLAENDFLVGLSLDGPPECHDPYRRDAAGQPTSEKVLRALQLLRKHSVRFNTLTVVHNANVGRPLDVYRFFRDEGVEYIQFIPLVDRSDRCRPEVTPETPEPARFGEFLCGIFDEWMGRDRGRIFIQHFDVAFAAVLGLPSPLCVHDKTCGRALLLEHNGDLYACDHFVYSENRLGNILETPLTELVTSKAQRAFGRAKRDTLPEKCRTCDVLEFCHGGCPKDRFVPTGERGKMLNYLCEGYRTFFVHTEPRLSALVQTVLEEQDSRVDEEEPPGRNEPCPCGSGLKYKRCCGKSER